MSPALPEIVANTRAEVALRREKLPLSALEGRVSVADRRFAAAMAGDELKLVTEIKPSSPSAGVLRESLDLAAVLDCYNRFASAISVLTDRKYFGGSLELLAEVAAGSPRPTLCKDFVLDIYQVFEARTAGAQAVLLIVKILPDGDLRLLSRLINDLGMVPVVEVQTDEELTRALGSAADCILINNRNLGDFTIDLGTTERLAPKIPPSVTTISASGVTRRADIERLLPFCSRFLVGSALMQSADMSAKLEELLGG